MEQTTANLTTFRSVDRKAAASYARNKNRDGVDSVLIRTVAAPEAIVCLPHMLGALSDRQKRSTSSIGAT